MKKLAVHIVSRHKNSPNNETLLIGSQLNKAKSNLTWEIKHVSITISEFSPLFCDAKSMSLWSKTSILTSKRLQFGAFSADSLLRIKWRGLEGLAMFSIVVFLGFLLFWGACWYCSQKFADGIGLAKKYTDKITTHAPRTKD